MFLARGGDNTCDLLCLFELKDGKPQFAKFDPNALFFCTSELPRCHLRFLHKKGFLPGVSAPPILLPMIPTEGFDVGSSEAYSLDLSSCLTPLFQSSDT